MAVLKRKIVWAFDLERLYDDKIKKLIDNLAAGGLNACAEKPGGFACFPKISAVLYGPNSELNLEFY